MPSCRCLWQQLPIWFCCLLFAASLLGQTDEGRNSLASTSHSSEPFALVSGVAQDAGYPQAGCEKDCCRRAWEDASYRRHPVSLAIVDPQSEERWLLDCSPALPEQLRALDHVAPRPKSKPLHGILLTHAHIGHYLGLAHLGREAMGAKEVPVYAMPRMAEFLTENGPWSQLIELRNIKLKAMTDGKRIKLNERVSVTPILVPHRDEFSEPSLSS